ncbi:BED-type domain-containing protein [Citrus sinensis]|uniref:BED-type domain-containing protein n=1 Tax=Citrus sinensis TaxID=2711 RepID=A0ACB8I2C6_CITSI|nr:BED-type domain-containing protein [Citrus sinensis]
MVVTVHFVDSNSQLLRKISSFSQITSHKGDLIGKEIEIVLHDWGIDRILTINVDNAFANDLVVKYVKRKLKSWQVDGTLLGGKFLHLRCCAHIINLIVGEGLTELKGSVTSIRNAVRYVKSSPARENRFKKCVEHEKIKSKGSVVLDVVTRWNFTCLMLSSAFKFRKAFERLEEEDEHYRNYFKEDVDGSGNTRPPKPEDWNNASVFVQFLEIFKDATMKFSASLTVTSNLYFHRVSTMQSLSKSQDSDSMLSAMAKKMKTKFDKYWGSVENMNKLLIIAVVLDPRYKLDYGGVCFFV